MEAIKDILKGAGIGGFVTLVVLALSVRDAAAQPSASEGRGASGPADLTAAAQRGAGSTSAPTREASPGNPSRDLEPSDLAIADAPPRSVRPLPRLSGVPHPMAALDGDVLAATG
ncbi:MAG: hypothetical protein AVDCRST_MAG69-1329 [uncultured Solirubrobacteraceae bacterium]|uniref:Uncharacterized protein n=1 Tax=uncultured Solirubrobacteraceae bacterium TaxID=1162706 RepID=A0A6J4S6K9_9ACTN|nr:MAG: hypothetical protein AVDCRST_MAG69-1329 [uncultured Solirubrobacteraceae bacterium]